MRGRAWAFAVVSALVLAPGWGAEGPYRGRPLAEVLEEFRVRGLTIIHSSAVVTDDLVVTSEPAASDPRKALVEILASLHLEAREGPGGVLVIAPAPAATDERPVGLSGFTTEIVVTPGAHSILDEDSQASRIVDSSLMLRVPEIGSDVSRMVERLPGVSAADNSAAFHARGGLPGDSSLVLDGLELYAPYHLAAFQAPFSVLDSRVIDRVEFRNGGFTADRGDRHGAFLDVTTVLPSERGGEIELGTLNSGLWYGAPLRRGAGAFVVSLRAWYPEAFLDTLELGAGERLRPRFEDLYAKVGWMISPRTFLSLHALGAQDRMRWEERGESDAEIVDADTESVYAWSRLVSSISRSVTSETVLSAGRIDAGRTGVAVPDDGVFDLDDERELRFLGLTEDVRWQAGGRQVLRGGISVKNLSADYLYTLEAPADPSASAIYRPSPRGTSWGAYVSHRLRVSPVLATEIGLRWDRQRHTDDAQLGPRFHLLWKPGDSSEFRFALGRYAQSQRIHELRVEDGETGFHPAEIARQVEATFLREFPGGVRVRLDAYHRRLSHVRPRYENLFQPLDLFPETSEDRVQVAPTGTRLRGVEILVSGDPAANLLWWVSYTRSSAEDLLDGKSVPRSWDQPHAGKFLLGYRWGETWSASLAGTIHTGWPTTPIAAVGAVQEDGSIVVEPVLGPRNSIRVPGYGRLDAKVRRSFAVRQGTMSVTLEVLNLTDRKNVCCVDDLVVPEPAAGPVDARPEYSSWLGITPTFQVRWGF